MKLSSCSVFGHLHFPRACLWSAGGKPVGYFDINLFSQLLVFLVCSWFSHILLCVIDTGDCWLWTEIACWVRRAASPEQALVFEGPCGPVWRLLFRDLWQGLEGAWSGGSWWRVLMTPRPAASVNVFTCQRPLSPAGWVTDRLPDPLPHLWPLSAFQVYIIRFPKKLPFPDGMCFASLSSVGAPLDKL